MVVFKPTEEMALTQQASPKLRRSRRLSSTRGLVPKNIRELGERDLNQKLGLCPIMSVRTTDKKSLDRGRLSQEWDFNEKISLSSGSSPRIDLRAGFELAKDSARLAELRGEGKNSSQWYVNRTACKDSRVIQENVIKSDSKYEIGVPKESGKVPGKTKVQRNRESETAGSSSKTMQRSSRDGEKTTGTKSRSKVSKDKIEKANDSISKRLELIHELNQRILANYEKFQQKSKRSHSKSSKDSKEALRGLRRDSEVSGRKPAENLSTVSKELIAYSQVTKTRQKTIDPTRDTQDFQRQKSDTSKFTFSRDYCERLVSKLDKPETNRKKGRAPVPPKKQPSNPKTLRDVNENFSMAPRANFYQPQNLPEVCEPSFKVTRKPHSTVSSHTERKKLSKDNGSRFCLEEEKDKKKMITVPKVNPVLSTESALKDARQGELHEPKCVPVLTKSENVSSGMSDHIRRISERPDDGETILEKRILDDLNRTISKFDVETDTPQVSVTESQSSTGKTESFSSDSIESGSSPSTKMKNGSFDSSCCHVEPFNSSWDSGVGGDVCGGSGWVRVHTGIESSLVYLTLETTAKDVCRDMLLGEDLSLFVQYGGEPGRRLAPSERPLELQDSFLQRLGYLEASRRARLGVDPELRHLVAFHVGPAAPLPELNGYSQCGNVLVLKGLVFPQWKRRPLAVIGSRLFLYPASPDSSPEWMELGGNGSAVCCAPSRLGRLVLRVTGYPRITAPRQGPRPRESPHHPETRHLYLGFHHPWDRDLWRGWLKQATQHPSCPRLLDLSKGGLSRIPDSTIAFPAIEELILGQNQLGNPDSNLAILQRFPRLSVVHLQRNNLKCFPRELLELNGLTTLDLSDNLIAEIPPDINRLVNLEELTLDRNGLRELPSELSELRYLRIISVVGNSLEALPSFLRMRALAVSDVQHRGDHQGSKYFKDEKNNRNNLNKVNLRNNQLKGSIILGNYGNLTHLDVSENNIETLDISALQGLRSVRCARNILRELTLCGRNLISLIAGNNKLTKLTVEPVPTNLEHLDISYNSLDSLPDWTPEAPLLRALFASNNALTALPDRLLSQPSRLEVLHLPHNRLQALPPPRRPLNLAHLTLQGNTLTALPENFFHNTTRLKVLNLSNNRLTELPSVEDSAKTGQGTHCLEKLYVTGNCLTDTALDSLARLPALRVLHAAYNSLDTMPESCIAAWTDLEELVLSGNRLQYLPDNVALLRHLRVLRVHSNRLLTCPTFNKTNSLRVLDLAHNQLDRINLESLVPPQLQFLDISCNSRLHVDPRQFQVYRSQRPLSLVDVSGQNRSSLPSHPHHQEMVTAERNLEQPWRLGFSETAGGCEKLFVSQIRMPAFCNVEGLFGVFDGGSNQEAPVCLQEMIPRLLLEERTIKETSKDYLKYTLLSAHRELKEKGQKYGVDATLVHLTRIPSTPGYPRTSRRYALKIGTSGDAKAVLCRAAGPLVLAPAKKSQAGNQLGNAAMFPLVVPDPVTEEVLLEDDDEFVIVGNRRLWEVLSVQEAVREARAEASPVLAAKRLQDLAQAYGAEENLSVIVLRLTGPGTGDIDQLMRELRHAVGKTRNQNEGGGCICACCQPPALHKSPAPCCCHVNNGYYLNGVLKNIVNSRTSKSQEPAGRGGKPSRTSESDGGTAHGDDRSSPSGQSDQASDSTFKSRQPSGRGWVTGSGGPTRVSRTRQDGENRKSGGTGSPEADDALSERSGALSEEQFRCWEYMLEQNTQLLFDKELDTLTRSPLRRGQSRSTPHLTGNLPFLSKRFGSARTFNPGLPRTPVRFGSGRRFLTGGPNAAYFGSLQRLMPYNLEYDFAVIQERSGLDSLEQDTTRMQQYWGVATTEL
ncbi:PH domain leucine-rich repeat-containing protein phosphatase 2 [Neodiprion lecontei]|uniref:PH domain leucine-rich repeat-containing protein phosphatase 2 n=1 Tax=Neodiprion lecontei TaxID=441921 RepID=A0ABM3FLM3_NEOLC|nr:PH domain leucine-rich repeat-containing protein phosphatase 2 [Neodiprion lecontei]